MPSDESMPPACVFEETLWGENTVREKIFRCSGFSSALLIRAILGVICFLPFFVPLAHASDGSAPRIVGGQNAKKGAWPWIAALVSSGSSLKDGQFCGGSLIGKHWVVTAAHCITEDDGSVSSIDSFIVALGAYDLAKPQGSKRFVVKRIIRNPSYNPSTVDSDIALIELAKDTSGYPFLPVQGDDDTLEGIESTVVGWGSTDPAGRVYPTILQQVSVPVISNEVCQEAFNSYGYTITDYMLCAGYASGGKDSCYGDSGGPLLVQRGDQWVMAGIVSFGGDLCAQSGEYGIYSRISTLRSFIDSSTDAAVIGGYVTDSLSGAPVSDVSVSVSGTKFETVTDSVGHYSLRMYEGDLKEGTKKLNFTAKSYRTATVSFQPAYGTELLINQAIVSKVKVK